MVCSNSAIRRSLLDSLWPRSSSDLPLMDLASILAATGNFSKANKLGEGGFGPVYKGFVADGVKKGRRPQAIAVKLWDPEGAQGHKEWLVRAVYSSPLLSAAALRRPSLSHPSRTSPVRLIVPRVLITTPRAVVSKLQYSLIVCDHS